MKILGGFPTKIGTQIRFLITYNLAIFMAINIAKLYVISKFIWDSISIGNPPNESTLYRRGAVLVHIYGW